VSGFSPDWLALREPADHRARNGALLQAVRARFAGRSAVSVVDLGCGAGSNLRALAPVLPARQRWCLIDHDAGLLEAARERLTAWADAASPGPEALSLVKDGRSLVVVFRRADLARDLGRALGPAPDLVTAAALVDLVLPNWIRALAWAVAARKALFYTVLAYDGAERWTPPNPHDAAVLRAFQAHQGRDKGFGPAAGPRAIDVVAAAFAQVGYEVTTAASPWRLGPADAALMAELARGIARAASETGLVPEHAVARWLAGRAAGASCVIGHRDCLAVGRS
jgi:hypothetical protein